MLLTEKQAAAAWCPRVGNRAVEHMGNPANHRLVPLEYYSCLGSKCMAWRWKADPDAPTRTIPMYGTTGEPWSCKYCNGTGKVDAIAEGAAEPDTCGECEGQGKGALQAPLGYCGLAGPLELLR